MPLARTVGKPFERLFTAFDRSEALDPLKFRVQVVMRDALA
jgi:hypothetical protein